MYTAIDHISFSVGGMVGYCLFDGKVSKGYLRERRSNHAGFSLPPNQAVA